MIENKSRVEAFEEAQEMINARSGPIATDIIFVGLLEQIAGSLAVIADAMTKKRKVVQMAEIKLKPCPHCGSEATIAIHPIVGSTVNLYTVECMNFRCPNPEPTSECYLMEEAAVKAWNEKDGESHDD